MNAKTNRATRAPKIKLPEGYESEAAFLSDMRELYDLDAEFDKKNRDEGIEDARFVAGRQWDDADRRRRLRAKKPVMQVNRLPAFVQQVTGNRRMNETVIKVVPDNGGSKEVARIREGLIRSIQKNSHAETAYAKALENQVICGIGNFRVDLEYATDDVFEQDIRIRPIPNPYSVIWDRMRTEPTGRDARHCFVVDVLPEDTFKKRWPWATCSEIGNVGDSVSHINGWFTEGTVRVVSYWRMDSEPRMLALMRDGVVVDITDIEDDEWMAEVVLKDDGTPMMRTAQRSFAEMYLCTGLNVLEGPYRLPIDRVPVFRVPAWELNVEEEVYRFGLIRFLKDPQRLHNYWRSTIAEKLIATPKGNWVASDDAVKGREKAWRDSHLSDDPLLIYNGEAGAPPARIPPAQIETSLIQEAGMAAQDIKDVANMHEAAMGQVSNEVSGRAIMARQRVAEVGTFIYHDNLNLAIEEAGRVINNLIPVAYDTARVIKVIGADNDEELVRINDAEDLTSVDITAGKYAVSVTTGPSYVTKRIEAAESMLAMVNAMPETMSVVADMIVEAQDWPGSEEVARRLRLTLPAGMVKEDNKTPEQLQAEQAQQQQQAQMAEIEAAKAQAEIRERTARAMEAEARATEAAARAKQAEALAAKAWSDIGVNEARAASDIERNESEIETNEIKAATEVMERGRSDYYGMMDRARGTKDDN